MLEALADKSSQSIDEVLRESGEIQQYISVFLPSQMCQSETSLDQYRCVIWYFYDSFWLINCNVWLMPLQNMAIYHFQLWLIFAFVHQAQSRVWISTNCNGRNNLAICGLQKIHADCKFQENKSVSAICSELLSWQHTVCLGRPSEKNLYYIHLSDMQTKFVVEHLFSSNKICFSLILVSRYVRLIGIENQKISSF